jgi:hypothetical protein
VSAHHLRPQIAAGERDIGDISGAEADRSRHVADEEMVRTAAWSACDHNRLRRLLHFVDEVLQSLEPGIVRDRDCLVVARQPRKRRNRAERQRGLGCMHPAHEREAHDHDVVSVAFVLVQKTREADRAAAARDVDDFHRLRRDLVFAQHLLDGASGAVETAARTRRHDDSQRRIRKAADRDGTCLSETKLGEAARQSDQPRQHTRFHRLPL